MKKEKKQKKEKRPKRIMSILGGSFLVREEFKKQFPFMVFVTILLMALITNTYIAEDRNREIARNGKILNDLQVEYIQLKSDIMQASKQSVLAKKLKNSGIKEPLEPLKRIHIEEQPATTERSHED